MQAVERQAGAGEFTINYATAGGGEAVLMLHGSEPAETWKVWEPMLGLADTYKLIAPDLVGFGKSTRPAETPDYVAQAHAVRDLAEGLSVAKGSIVGSGWGGQVALELALTWPEMVRAVVLLASSYDKDQLRRLEKLRRPTLIVFAEDDMVTQLKAGYLLRDAIGTSRLEVLDPVARDPKFDFRMSHRLQGFRGPQVMQLVRLFLAKPEEMVAEPPQLEEELKGMALRKEAEKGGEAST
ncbi:MAG: alpha/beta hydrolase [archaeon]|nr:MAG: alpha/beta hydrolase [archaeon]